MIRNLNFLGLIVLLYWIAVSGTMLMLGAAMLFILLLGWRRIHEDGILGITAYCAIGLLWLRLGYLCLDVMKYQIQATITGTDVDSIFWGDFPQNVLLFFIPGFIWLFLSLMNSIHVSRLIYKQVVR